MRKLLFFLCLMLVGIALAGSTPQTGGVERGKYLVEEVARCQECHTPRTPDGDWDRARWLQGATIWYRPIEPVKDWAYSAPPLAGLPSFSDADAMRVLERGMGPNGYPVRPPMHDYRLRHEDAAAIVAYLRSLRPR